jgi:hypothetical protein
LFLVAALTCGGLLAKSCFFMRLQFHYSFQPAPAPVHAISHQSLLTPFHLHSMVGFSRMPSFTSPLDKLFTGRRQPKNCLVLPNMFY